MGWISGIRRQFRLPVTQRDIDAEIEDELRFHMDARIEELRTRGMSDSEARARARREFGDVEEARSELTALGWRRARGEHRAEVWGDVGQDVRFALRTLARAPGFTLTAAATLALAVGVTTALVAVVDQTLLRPLPFAAADELVVLNGVALPERDVRGGSYAEVGDWGEMTNSFTGVSINDVAPYNLSYEGGAEQVTGEVVSANYLELLGVTPLFGRGITERDDVSGAERVILISHALWQRRFGGTRDVIGSVVQLDGSTATIVGVLPEDFRGLSFSADVWLPLLPFGPAELATARGGRWLGAVARLRPGVSVEAAQADIERAAVRLAELYPESNTNRSADVVALRDSYLRAGQAINDTRTLLFAVSAAVAMLLLIGCVNVTNLQLVRGLSRSGEVAVRFALGASRGRVVRQLMTEAVVLALAGGAIGILLAFIATRAAVALLPAGVLPPYAAVSVDARVIAIALLVVAGAGVLAGLVPALRTTSGSLAGELRSSSRTIGGRHERLQRTLVAGEMALALALIAVAALMVRSLRAQLAIDPGFEAEHVMAGRVMLLGDRYDTAGRLQFVDAALDRLRSQPGIRAVAMTSDAPLRGSSSAGVLALPERPDQLIRYYRHRITPGYFEVAGIDILAGRGLTTADREDSPSVVVVSEAFAQRLFPAGGAVGRQFLFSPADTVMIVGVAENVRQRNLTTDLFDPGEDPDVYFALAQLPTGGLDILVRGERTLPSAETINAAVQAVDPGIPLFRTEALSATLEAQTANARFGSMLLGAFALLAVCLAAVGLYGVMAFLVQARQRELAVRAAMGAAPAGLVALVLRHALLLVALGALAGVAMALAAGRLLASLLYGVAPVDALSLSAAVAVLAACGLAAAAVPALRAVRTDPQLVLRAD